SYSDTGLTPGTTYYYKVSAYTKPNGESAPSNIVSSLPQISGPAAVAVSGAGWTGPTVGWTQRPGTATVVGVYVDNAHGSFTPAEQARIHDAMDQLNSLWTGTAGLRLVEVADPGQANIVVQDPVTGPANGLLGATLSSYTDSLSGARDSNGNPYFEFSGPVVVDLFEGWNWYTGSAPTGIAANQY